MRADAEARRSGRAMGSTFVMVVHADDAALLPRAQAHIDDLERRWSRFRSDSEISRLNRSPARPVIVSPDTYQVVRAAVHGAELTQGRFDPTVHDTMRAIGYDRSFEEIDSTATVTTSCRVGAPGVADIEFDDALHAITLPPGVRVDLGGIGKGTAADRVTERLIAGGARGAAVSIGGDIRVRGESPSNAGWTITYAGTPLDMAPLRDGGVCTSSTARRRWSTTAGATHHLVDPRTGGPVADSIESVTVVGATAQQAEVLTKAAMVCGIAAPTMLESHGVTAFIRWSTAA